LTDLEAENVQPRARGVEPPLGPEWILRFDHQRRRVLPRDRPRWRSSPRRFRDIEGIQMRIESIECPEDRLVKVVKRLVATHNNQTPNTLRALQVDLEPVLVV
jgi:hypothetical protein